MKPQGRLYILKGNDVPPKGTSEEKTPHHQTSISLQNQVIFVFFLTFYATSSEPPVTISIQLAFS